MLLQLEQRMMTDYPLFLKEEMISILTLRTVLLLSMKY
jgi:hypothetical protein